jgi:hypothetical protein
MDYTQGESVSSVSRTKTQRRFSRLTDYVYKIIHSPKDAIQEPIYPSLASATDAAEAHPTERLSSDVGRASTPTTCPEGTVRLHVLCESCTLFAQHSVTLSWLDGSNPHSYRPPRERYRLCTVAHLRRLDGRCHLCTALCFFVSSWISRHEITENVDKSWLYLGIWSGYKPWEHDSLQLSASIDRSSVGSYSNSNTVKRFDLCLLAGT